MNIGPQVGDSTAQERFAAEIRDHDRLDKAAALLRQVLDQLEGLEQFRVDVELGFIIHEVDEVLEEVKKELDVL